MGLGYDSINQAPKFKHEHAYARRRVKFLAT
jgi:hypothetical protein